MPNPYPRHPGFAARVNKATKAFKRLANDPMADIYTRDFDNCFEMYDGDAVVWQLMEQAKTDQELARGIKTMCGDGKCWQRWQATHAAPGMAQATLF